MENYFTELNKIDVGDKIEKKGKLSYLSWAYAWGELKKRHPDASYRIYESANGCFYHTDGLTCWVKTGVTVNGLEHIEYLPVMDNSNNSIPLDKIDSFAVNKAIQRSLTKAVARHGLGLYIYAGEDLPDSAGMEESEKADAIAKNRQISFQREEDPILCRECGDPVKAVKAGGKVIPAEEFARQSGGLCGSCYKEAMKHAAG